MKPTQPISQPPTELVSHYQILPVHTFLQHELPLLQISLGQSLELHRINDNFQLANNQNRIQPHGGVTPCDKNSTKIHRIATSYHR